MAFSGFPEVNLKHRFMLEKDRLFAQVNLQSDELKLYDQVYENLSMEAPSPDLVIYLQAPVEILMQRIMLDSQSDPNLYISAFDARI